MCTNFEQSCEQKLFAKAVNKVSKSCPQKLFRKVVYETG